MGTLAVPAPTLLGFGDVGGLTFGPAAEDLVSNFIGGSMLAVMRPFSPGEKIYLVPVNGRFRGTNEPNAEGYSVKDIGRYQTTLVPKETRPTTVLNGFFLGANVIDVSAQNRSRHRRHGPRVLRRRPELPRSDVRDLDAAANAPADRQGFAPHFACPCGMSRTITMRFARRRSVRR